MVVHPDVPKELAEVSAELQKTQQAFEEFASITAHDLKEPMRGIITYINFIFEDHPEELSPELLDRLEKIKHLANHTTRLIESIRTFSKITTAEESLREIDQNEVVQRVLDRLDELKASQGTEIRLMQGLPPVVGRLSLVEMIWFALIENSLKYNDKAEKWVEIGYEVDTSPPLFFVKDNGMGIDPRHHEKVFKLFKRAATRSRFGDGMGTGLAFAQKIVERHGGRIELISEKDEGSTVRFSLEPS